MEVDTINVVKLPSPNVQRRRSNPLPYALMEQDLQRALEQWMQLLHYATERKEVIPRSRTYEWSTINIAEELPTDLLTYFVYQLEPDIAPEIGELILDGRVHLVLILSHCRFPIEEDWCQRFKVCSLRGRRSPGGIVIPDMSEESSMAPLIQLHEMNAFTGKILRNLLETIEERKKKYDFNGN
ncbi:hypothetical protein HYZ98_02820 [Candidatus Peregrinibacteria bacterium]|nr:hypothetical protein [Candidatus Peregrinibacteria bacterium]